MPCSNSLYNYKIWNYSSGNNCGRCGKTAWSGWTITATQITDTITCQKQVCRLDKSGNVTNDCSSCTSCGSINGETCTGSLEIIQDVCR